MDLVHESSYQHLPTVTARKHFKTMKWNKAKEYTENKAGSDRCIEGITNS